MPAQKLLLKQTAIILTALIFAYAIGYYYDYNYADLYLYSLFALITVMPILALMFIRIKQSKDFNKVALALKIWLWFSLILFTLALFNDGIFGIIYYYFDYPIPFSQRIAAYDLANLFSPTYWLEWLGYNLKQLPDATVYYAPYLVMIALLTWAGFSNKKVELKKT